MRQGPSRTVTLVRHGECVLEGADPEKGGPLTPRGRRQAEETGRSLRPARVTGLLASDLPRTAETAGLIAGALGFDRVEHDQRIRECLPPLPLDAPIRSSVPEALMESSRETLDEVSEELFRPFDGEVSHLVLVSHGNVIRFLLARALGGDELLWTRFSLMRHASLSVVVVEEGKPARLKAYNSTEHLEPGLLSS